MKKFFFTFIFIALLSCYEDQQLTKNQSQELKAMENIIKCTLIESQSDEKVSAKIELLEKLESGYSFITLAKDGNDIAVFSEDNLATIDIDTFGEQEVEIVYYLGSIADYANRVEVERIQTTINPQIQTWFCGAHLDIGYYMQKVLNGGLIDIVTSKERAVGNRDICMRLVLRIPFGKKITITSAIDSLPDLRPIYNKALEVHYRLADYKYRNELYNAPDEALYHIDAETDKWINEKLTLESGVHVVYVAPSLMHDLSYLNVMIVSHDTDTQQGFNASITTYQKTIDFESLNNK